MSNRTTATRIADESLRRLRIEVAMLAIMAANPRAAFGKDAAGVVDESTFTFDDTKALAEAMRESCVEPLDNGKLGTRCRAKLETIGLYDDTDARPFVTHAARWGPGAIAKLINAVPDFEFDRLVATCTQLRDSQFELERSRKLELHGLLATLAGTKDAQALLDEPPAQDGPAPIVRCLANVEAEPIEWLWKHKIATGKPCAIIGPPGCGKSMLTTHLAACVSNGWLMPDGSPARQGSVMFVCAEDDAGDTIRPRLDAAGANLQRIHVFDGWSMPGDDGKAQLVQWTVAQTAMAAAALDTVPDCALMIIDPIGSYTGGGVDAHRDNEVRSALMPLVKLANERRVAVVFVMHTRKAAGGSADDRALGSRAFIGIVRSSFHVLRDAEDKNRRLFLPGKNNLAAEGDGYAFSIVDDGKGPRCVWEAEPIPMNADEAFEQAEKPSKRGPAPEARDEAAAWLTRLLANGPMATAAVFDAGGRAGFAEITMRRAGDALKVIRERVPGGKVYQWRLNAEATPTLDAEVPDAF